MLPYRTLKTIVTIAAAIACPAADRTPVGLTASGSLIEADLVSAGVENSRTVMLIGGFSSKRSSEIIQQEIRSYAALPMIQRKFHILAISEANPDRAVLKFPPAGHAYRDNSESHYLWRWTALHAPDLVIVVGDDPFGFAQAISANDVAGIGKIASRRTDQGQGVLNALKEVESSAAARQLAHRLARNPLDVAQSLEPFYGHEFREAVYIPAMALTARIRLGQIDDVRRIVEPFTKGTKDSLANATASHLSGHLIFGELAEKTGDNTYVNLVRHAADLGFEPDGTMKQSMPYHNEMSDSVFMGCPILAKAGKLTGDKKYFDMALRHFRYMAGLDRRADGLYRHSPLDEAAWGRGNAFPALGLALTLSDLPKEHPAFDEMLASYRSLMNTLARFQDKETGMWRQVVDKPGSYPEFSATAMIARAMLIGIRNGWLEENTYQPRVQAAWRAISARVSTDGRLVDVCESTGKQRTLTEYLQREAILGRDPRGGGMAMMFATEIAGLK